MKKRYFAVLLILSIIAVACGDPNTEGKTYSILYHGNGESGGYAPQDNKHYVSGENAIVKNENTLYKDGYKFLHWNTKPLGDGVSYNAGDTITVNNITIFLYAIWGKMP